MPDSHYHINCLSRDSLGLSKCLGTCWILESNTGQGNAALELYKSPARRCCNQSLPEIHLYMVSHCYIGGGVAFRNLGLFPCGSAGKESTCNVRDLSLTPELGRSLGEGKGYPLQYSGLENSMD